MTKKGAFTARWRVRLGKTSTAANLRAVADAYPRAFAAALYQEAFAVGALANSAGYVPVDTGRMRASQYISPPTTTASGRVVVRVGYGTAYAIFVHERRELRHTTGRAGWLLDALTERAKGIDARLAERTRILAAKGGGVQPLEEGGGG